MNRCSSRVVGIVTIIAIMSAPLAAFSYSQPTYYSEASYYSQPAYYSQGTYYSQTYYQGSYATTTLSGNVLFTQDLFIYQKLSKGSGTFTIDHPLNPWNMLLYHSFVESPDVLNLYDGIATLDENGNALITLPDYFMALNTNFRYQFFPLYEPMPNLYIGKEIENNTFVISGGEGGGQVSWQVTGVRHDPYILQNPIITEVDKGPGEIVDKGHCLFEPLCL